MGQASAAMRAAGHADLAPGGVLSLLDGLLAEVISAWKPADTAPQFATACYAIVEPQHGRVRAANAGHLPLLIRGVDGQVRVAAPPTGPPLGLGVGGFAELDIPVHPGETLAMFTDGLVESRTQDTEDGIYALATLLGRLGGGEDLDRVAEELLADMGRRPGHGPDDVALVLLRLDAAA
jgi:serine phosphatase RsbU (regulator of sigma subunit)